MDLKKIYDFYKKNKTDTDNILLQFKNYIEQNKEEVTATLQSVASGELEIIETVSPEEEEYFRALCGWIVVKGSAQALGILQLVQTNPAILDSRLEDIDAPTMDIVKRLDIVTDINHAIKDKQLNERSLTRLAILLVSYIFYDEFHYPQPETGVYNISGNPFQKLKWLYRYWFNQLEVAEKRSQLEDFFASQMLDFICDERLDYLMPSVSVSCAGDLLAVDVLIPENTPHLFDEITDFYSTADVVSANLESTVDERQPIGRSQNPGEPARMNTSKAMFDKFRNEAGINYFSTATNHAMDWGICGLNATLDVLEKSGAYYSGTTKSCAEKGKEQDGFTIIEKNGIKIAMLAYTFDLNGYETPADKPYLVNVVRFNDADPAPDYSLIKKHVTAAKTEGADWIIAYCHWGWEFEMYPHANIREAAYKVVDCGVDTILGNHAHVSQPAEAIPRSGKQDALVIYAFGDFVSYHPESRNSKLSYTVKFDIRKDGARQPSIYLANLKALPIYIVNARRDDGSYDCRIVKFYDVLKDPDGYGLTELEKSQLPHLEEKVWNNILSPLSEFGTRQ